MENNYVCRPQTHDREHRRCNVVVIVLPVSPPFVSVLLSTICLDHLHRIGPAIALGRDKKDQTNKNILRDFCFYLKLKRNNMITITHKTDDIQGKLSFLNLLTLRQLITTTVYWPPFSFLLFSIFLFLQSQGRPEKKEIKISIQGSLSCYSLLYSIIRADDLLLLFSLFSRP